MKRISWAAVLSTAIGGLVLASPQRAIAADGALDTTFNGTGIVTTAVGSGADQATGVALQADGKIVVVGYSNNGSNDDFVVLRYNTNGSLDTSFNTTGKVMTPVGPGNDQAAAVAIQQDGKILVAGTSSNGSNNDFALVRYNTDGSLDTSFNTTGKVTTAIGSGADSAAALAIQTNYRIVVAGSTSNGSNNDFAVARYLPNGSLDSSFNSVGVVTTSVGLNNDTSSAVAVAADGSIVVAGTANNGSNNDFALVQYSAGGVVDAGFNDTGKVTTAVGSGADVAASLAIQNDGKLVVAGSSSNGSNNDFAVVRYLADGSLDATFNVTGIVTTAVGSGTDTAASVALQSDGKVVVAGTSSNGSNNDFAAVRYLTTGALDTAFNSTGKVTTPVGSFADGATGVVAQSDHRLVLVGYSGNGSNNDIAVVRYDTAMVPGAPTGVTAMIGDQQATVSWFAPADNGGRVITSYTVTADPGGEQCSTATLSCTVSDLNNGTTYTFSVVASNAIGDSAASDPSDEFVPATVPGAPTGVTATIGNGQATVSWLAPADTGGRAVTGYTVTADPGGEQCVTATLSCVVSDLTNGTTYTFTVVASNAIGDSAASDPSDEFVPATVPGAPTGVTATIGNGEAMVSWLAPVDDGGRAVTGYMVTADPGGEQCATASLSCVVSDLTNGTTYTFTVVASNAMGDGAASDSSDEFVPATVPGAPVGVAGIAGDGEVTVSWVAPLDDGGLVITEYTVTAIPGDRHCTTATLSCTVSDLTNGTTYTFTVVASNAIGDSAASDPSDEFVPATVPGAPVGVAGIAGDGEVTVSWVAPLDDGGLVITEYTVTAIPGDRHCTTDTTTCVVTGLTNGTAYRFSVVATNSLGDGEAGGPSQAVTPLADDTPVSPDPTDEPEPPPASSTAGFTPLALQRLFDTRPTEPQGAVTVTKQRYGGLKVLTVKVTGSADVPETGVAAVSLNLTAVDSVGPGFATVFPCGPRPLASNLNFVAGDVVPNLVIAPVSPSGEVCVFASVDTHLVADVNGWFAVGSGFNPLVPSRLFDTRVDEPQGSVIVAKHRYGSQTLLTVKVIGAAGIPPTDVGAVSLNVTAVLPQAPGFLTVFPCGSRPLASNLNFVTGDVVPNLVIAPVSAAGEVCVFASGDTDIVADVTGWFATGSEFSAMVPTRLFDTRPGEPNGAVGVAKQRFGGSNVLRVRVLGVADIPITGVRAVSLNVTAVDPVGAGYVTVFACGPVPLASHLNFDAGEIKPNSVIAPVSSDGDICLFASVDTHLVADVNGWFAAD